MEYKFKVKGNYLTRLDDNTIITSSKNEFYADFSFDISWYNIKPITVNFEKEQTIISIILDENNRCRIPWEVMTDSGVINICVVGGDLIPTNSVTVKVVGEPIKVGIAPTVASPSVYSSIVELSEGIKEEWTECSELITTYKNDIADANNQLNENVQIIDGKIANINSILNDAEASADTAIKNIEQTKNNSIEAVNNIKDSCINDINTLIASAKANIEQSVSAAASSADEVKNTLGLTITNENLTKAGYITSKGAAETLNPFTYSRLYKIPIGAKSVCVVNSYRNVGCAVAFYSKNEISTKNFISGLSITDPVTEESAINADIPEEAKYVAFSAHSSNKFLAYIVVTDLAEEITSKIAENAENIDNVKNSFSKKIQNIMSQLVLSDKTVNIKLTGDSTTAGQGGTGYSADGEIIFGSYYVNENGHCWANSLRDYFHSKFNCSVKNYGISGSTSKRIADNISNIVSDSDNILICMIGLNDRRSESGLSLNNLYNNLQTILNYCSTRNISTIFISCIPTSVENDGSENKVFHCEDIDNVMMKFSNDNNIEYISLYKLFTEYCETRNITIDSLLCSDGLHPNDNGYDVMFYLVCNALGISVKRPDATW